VTILSLSLSCSSSLPREQRLKCQSGTKKSKEERLHRFIHRGLQCTLAASASAALLPRRLRHHRHLARLLVSRFSNRCLFIQAFPTPPHHRLSSLAVHCVHDQFTLAIQCEHTILISHNYHNEHFALSVNRTDR
jgi:hypothetical protein